MIFYYLRLGLARLGRVRIREGEREIGRGLRRGLGRGREG